jgi:hypothetical protein
MEFTGAYQKKYLTQLQSDRKKERDKFLADTAQLLFVILHTKLDLNASADDYNQVLDIAIESARKLALVLFPDLTEKELEAAWKKVVEAA